MKDKCHFYQFLLQISERVPPLACLCVHSAAVQSSVNGRRVVKVSPMRVIQLRFPSPHLTYHASHLSLQTFPFLTPLSVKCQVAICCKTVSPLSVQRPPCIVIAALGKCYFNHRYKSSPSKIGFPRTDENTKLSKDAVQ